jgi:hypothetical protein
MRDSDDDNDLFGPQERKNLRYRQVWDNENPKTAVIAFTILEEEFRGQEIMVERVKIRYKLRGHNPPHHHNWWGAWTLKAIEQKKLIRVNRRDHCVGRRSNKRRAEVYYVP